MARFDGRVAIVTGGGRGIGQAYAKSLAEEGAKICVTDIIDTDNTVNIIKQAGGDAIGVKCDVLDKSQIEAMVGATVEAYGKVEILVNNAARFADIGQKPFMEISEDEWDRVMQVNTRGRYLDRWSRQAGRWGIDRRVFVCDFDEVHPAVPGSIPPRLTLDREDLSYALFAGEL